MKNGKPALTAALLLMNSFGTTAATPLRLVCEVKPAKAAFAASYAQELCAETARLLGGGVVITAQARMNASAPGRWALVRVTVSGAYSAKARLSLGTAAELLAGKGHRTPEIGSRIHDAELNSFAASNHAKALVENLPK